MTEVEYVPSLAMNEYKHRWSEIMHFMQMNMIANLQLPELLKNADKESLARLKLIASFSENIDDPKARQRVLLELILGRLVDDFKGYLCDIVRDVYKIRPDLVKERSISKKEKEEILNFYDVKEETDFGDCLAHYMVDKLSNTIKIDKHIEFCSDLIGIEIAAEPSDIKNASEALAVRNLLVHTKGLVNSRFISRTGRTDVRIGERIEFTVLDCQRWDEAMWRLIKVFDRAIVMSIGVEKFVELHQHE